MLVKNQNFGQKSKFLSKIQILDKYQKYGQKSELCFKGWIFCQQSFGEIPKFGQYSEFW